MVSEMRRLIFILLGLFLLLAVAIPVLVRCKSIRVPESSRLSTYHDEPYRELLAACVRDGLVDYHRLGAEHADDLDRFLDAVGRFGPETPPQLFATSPDRLAYYLNAYNALMLRKWLDAGAADADAARRVNRLWFFADFWRVDGSWLSLDRLEQRVIRPTFQEPLVHMALVCGAMGCPPLLEEPFVGERLDEQLEGLTRRWLREPDGLRVDEDGTVWCSRIFLWYRADFDTLGGLPGVLERYLDPTDPRRQLAIRAAREGTIQFMEYDWSINEAKPLPSPSGRGAGGSRRPPLSRRG